jgi:hypothetical protein
MNIERRVLAACAVMAISAGCGERMSEAEMTKQSQAELATRMPALQAKVTAIQALARAPLPKPEERITSPGVKLSTKGAGPATNLVYIPLEQLPSLTTKHSGVMFMHVEMSTPPQWMAGLEKMDGKHPNWVRDLASRFEGLQYVLILKTNRYVAPIVEATTYTPGTYAGEAHLVGVDGRRWGGVSFTASSSDSVTTRTKGEDQAWVEGDLKDRAWKAMNEAVKKHLPDVEL